MCVRNVIKKGSKALKIIGEGKGEEERDKKEGREEEERGRGYLWVS